MCLILEVTISPAGLSRRKLPFPPCMMAGPWCRRRRGHVQRNSISSAGACQILSTAQGQHRLVASLRCGSSDMRRSRGRPRNLIGTWRQRQRAGTSNRPAGSALLTAATPEPSPSAQRLVEGGMCFWHPAMSVRFHSLQGRCSECAASECRPAGACPERRREQALQVQEVPLPEALLRLLCNRCAPLPGRESHMHPRALPHLLRCSSSQPCGPVVLCACARCMHSERQSPGAYACSWSSPAP